MEIKKLNLLVVLLTCMASCSNDETVDSNNLQDEGETTTVKFEMNAETRNYSSVLLRSANPPIITKDKFRIMAFKKSPTSEDYFYTQDVPTDQMQCNNNVLSGIARLPIGKYKFVSTYGLVNNSGFTLPTFIPKTSKLNNDLQITHETINGTSVLFLGKEATLNDLQPYTLGLASTTNEPVSMSLSRAVARVDVLFIQAKKTDGNYEEVSDSTDVFGVTQLKGMEMQFTGLNKNVNLLGTKTTTDKASLFNVNFPIPNLENVVTKGTSNEDTKVGTAKFLSYDSIEEKDIKIGSAHVHGAYVLPFENAKTTTKLNLILTNSLGDQRTISVPGNLPLERNKVTLVKIYVLSGTVFNTDVNFNVTVDTVWAEANSVNGEIN